MPVSKEQATKIAQDFLRERLATCPVRLESPFVRRKQMRGRHCWVVMFDRVTPPDVVVSPEEVIVLVDEAGGTAEIELAL